MNIKFTEKEKEILSDLLENSSNDFIRIKVAFGCGKPYYEIFSDFRREDDIEENIEGINFIVSPKDVKACSDIEIVYTGRIGNNGFYVKC